MLPESTRIFEFKPLTWQLLISIDRLLSIQILAENILPYYEPQSKGVNMGLYFGVFLTRAGPKLQLRMAMVYRALNLD